MDEIKDYSSEIIEGLEGLDLIAIDAMDSVLDSILGRKN